MADASSPEPPRIYAAVLGVLGFAVALGGAYLAGLGGSPFYLLTGGLVTAAAVYLWRGRRLGAWLFAGMLGVSFVWGVIDVGFDAWKLMPRLLMWLVLGTWLLLPNTWRRLT